MRRLATIPGIGALNATALVAAVGEAEDFAHGRDLAAWLGLVPRQMTTGGKAPARRDHQARQRLSRATMLIHGARAALPGLSRSDTPLGAVATRLMARAHVNVVVVALASEAGADRLGGAAHGGDNVRRAGATARGGIGTARATRRRDGRRCLRVVEARWPDSRTASRNPGSKNGARDAGSFMRTGTRGSPSWPGARLRGRIRWRRLITAGSKNQLADGAGHTFL